MSCHKKTIKLTYRLHLLWRILKVIRLSLQNVIIFAQQVKKKIIFALSDNLTSKYISKEHDQMEKSSETIQATIENKKKVQRSDIAHGQ